MQLNLNTDLGKKGYDTNKNKMNLITDPDVFKKRIKELDDNFFLALDNFKESFYRFVINPKYDENKKLYIRDKAAIVNYEQMTFILDNDIQKSFDDVNKLIKEQDALNDIEKKKYIESSDKYKKVYGTDYSTKQMIHDKEYEYKIIYSKSIMFFAGSIGLFMFILKNYKSKST